MQKTNEINQVTVCQCWQAGAAITLRCVIIPEVNLRDSHLASVAALARLLHKCRGVNLMGYHPLGEGKRKRLGSAVELRNNAFTVMTAAQLEPIAEKLRALGCAQVSVF